MTDYFADDTQHPIAFHGIPASGADLLAEGNGKVCQ